MCETNREAICISTKYSVQIEPLYCECNDFISMLEKNLPDISHEMLNCDNQNSASANDEATTSLRYNHPNIGRIQRQLSSRFPQPKIEVKLKITAASAIVYQRYLTTIITILWVQTLLVTKPTLSSICLTLLQVNPIISTTFSWQENTTARVPN